MTPSYSAIIVAAGKGTRFSGGMNKLLYPLMDGTPVIVKTLRTFLGDPFCRTIVLVSSKQLVDAYREKWPFYGRMIVTWGGKTRQESVYRGLLACMGGKVLIHDGARPWIHIEDIHAVAEALEEEEAVCLTKKVTDTVKTVQGGRITGTLDRDALRLALTPQGFRYSVIRQCYERAMEEGWTATDDCQIYERGTGKKIRFVDAKHFNGKVTTREDVEGR